MLDGEIVALDARGEPTGFQQLQGRIHLTSAPDVGSQRVAFIAFDMLQDGDADLRDLPLTERRARLEAVLAGHTGPLDSPDARWREETHGASTRPRSSRDGKG